MLYFLYTSVFLCPLSRDCAIEDNQKTQEHVWTSTSERKGSDFAFFPAAMSCFVSGALLKLVFLNFLNFIFFCESEAFLHQIKSVQTLEKGRNCLQSLSVTVVWPASYWPCSAHRRDFLGARTGSVKLGLHCTISDMIFTQILIVWLWNCTCVVLCAGDFTSALTMNVQLMVVGISDMFDSCCESSSPSAAIIELKPTESSVCTGSSWSRGWRGTGSTAQKWVKGRGTAAYTAYNCCLAKVI